MANRNDRLTLLACNRKMNILKYYAVFSALFSYYFPENSLDDHKYDQDYAVNEGIIYG